jgi:symplekin
MLLWGCVPHTEVDHRGPHASSFGAQINEALSQQASRMERASAEEKARKAAVAASAIEATKKRPPSAAAENPSDAKRMKVEADMSGNASAAFLASFDFTTLPLSLITDLIVANLQAFTEPALFELVRAYRQNRGLAPGPPASRLPQPLEPTPEATPTTGPSAEPSVKVEAVDPLQMDIDEEEMEYEPDKLNMEVSTLYVLTSSCSPRGILCCSFRAMR